MWIVPRGSHDFELKPQRHRCTIRCTVRRTVWYAVGGMTRSVEATAGHPSVAERYRVLLDIGRTLTGTLSHDDLYRAIHRKTARVLEATGFYISLYDADRDLATIVFNVDRGVNRHVELTYRGSDSEVIREGRGSMVEDRPELRSASVVENEDGEVARSAITAPLTHKGKVLGVISTQGYRAHAYTTDDLELLQGIADVAAVALENAQFVAELERQRAEAEWIEEIGRALASSLDPQEVLQKVIDVVLAALPVDGAAVWLIENEHLARMAASAGRIAMIEGSEWDLRGPLEQRLLKERKPFIIPDLEASPAVPTGLREQLRGGSGIAVPLIVGSEVAGLLSAGSTRTDYFTEDQTRMLLRLSNQASLALENARLHASVQALSLTDALTGLPNRRHLNIHLKREIAAARRGRNLVVCMHDLDFFKDYNDSKGHLAGDDALRAYAHILAEENRAMNLVARYGGDEFVSVLSDSTLEAASIYVQRVEARMERDPVLAPFDIRASTGLAAVDRTRMKGAEDVLNAADTDLYRMKGKRRR